MTKTEVGFVEEADERLEKLVREATNDVIRVKLRNLNGVCRAIVMDLKERLSVPAVIKRYKRTVSDETVSISEQTIRNNRPNGNPYQKLYRTWEDIAERLFAATAQRPIRADGSIIGEGEIRKIVDPTLRHQVLLLFAQNRSLHNQLNIMKQKATDTPIRIDSPTLIGGDHVLTPAEVDAFRDFVKPQKLRAKHLVRTDDDGVRMMNGDPVADPGFVTAIEKILKSYQRP